MQMTPFSRFQLANIKRSNANAHKSRYLIVQQLKHAANLPIQALMNHDGDVPWADDLNGIRLGISFI